MGIQVTFPKEPRKSFSLTVHSIKKCPERFTLESKARMIEELVRDDVAQIDVSDNSDRVIVVCKDEEMVFQLKEEFKYSRLSTTVLVNGIALDNKDFANGSKPVGICSLATAQTMPVFKSYVMLAVPENTAVLEQRLRELELSGFIQNMHIRMELIISTNDFADGLPQWLASKMTKDDISRLKEYDPYYGVPQANGTVRVSAKCVMIDEMSDDDLELDLIMQAKMAEESQHDYDYDAY